MEIAKVEFLPCNMPQEDPEWRFSLRASKVSQGWIVCIHADDGTVGYGYASATPHMGASYEGLKGVLDGFAPTLIGKDPFAIEAILAGLERQVRGVNQAKAGIDCALHDLMARALKLPLYQLLGGKVRDSVPVMRVLSIKEPDEMAERGQRLLDAGYRYIKIKVDGDVDLDVARVRAIRARLGPDVHLIIDANQAYSPKDAITAINRMADSNVELFEQPVKYDDWAGLKLVTDSVPVAVEADESAGSVRDVMHLVSNRLVDAVSLKIPKLGGLRNVIAAARICEAGGIRYRLGAHVGTRLLSAQAMHLAAALPDVQFACELGEFTRLLDDPFTGIENENGMLTLPEEIGSGVSLNPPGGGEKAAAG